MQIIDDEDGEGPKDSNQFKGAGNNNGKSVAAGKEKDPNEFKGSGSDSGESEESVVEGLEDEVLAAEESLEEKEEEVAGLFEQELAEDGKFRMGLACDERRMKRIESFSCSC